MASAKWSLDLTPLRTSRDYRRLVVYTFFTRLANQAIYISVPFEMKNLTNSTLDVGSLGLFELLALLSFGLYGGVLADRLDRRRLIITMEACLVVTSGLLLFNARLHHPQVWLLYVVTFLIVSAGSLQQPSLAALNQSIVAHDLQRAAAVIGNVSGTTAQIVGPAIGGLVAVYVGVTWNFAATLALFAVSLTMLSTLSATPAPKRDEADGDVRAIAEGLRYARARPDIIGTYIVDFTAMALAYPVVMLPFVAQRFHESYALSILYCALPSGALVATLLSGWSRRVHHYGRAVVGAAAVWGLGIAAFGYSLRLPIVVAGLFVAGGADAVSAIFRQVMWNESIPVDVRGRMGGLELLSYAIGPTAGQFRAGVMAAWTSMRFSLTVGGLACTGGVGVIAAALPALWGFDVRTNPHVTAVRDSRASERDDTV